MKLSVQKILSVLLSVFLLSTASSLYAQQESAASSEDQEQTAAESTTDDEDLLDDSDLDLQTYEGDEEDEFIPTEEIPSDEPIPFPSNI